MMKPPLARCPNCPNRKGCEQCHNGLTCSRCFCHPNRVCTCKAEKLYSRGSEFITGLIPDQQDMEAVINNRAGSYKDRPSIETIYMKLAFLFAERSTCLKSAVGCLIVSEDHRKVFAVGHNGNAAGLPNGCDHAGPWNCGCLHAEENATINCDVDRSITKIVYSTVSPCLMCAKRIINLGGVTQFNYQIEYRDGRGAQALRDVGIWTDNLSEPR